MKIRIAQRTDAASIADIYNKHVLHSITTFETESVSISEWGQRIENIQTEYPFLVGEENKNILGYAYATKWKTRSAYLHTVEVSVYISEKSQGKGYGKALYSDLFNRLSANGIHCVIAGIAMPNDVSEHLHKSLGFELIGTFKEVGNKFNKWVDVRYYQLTLS